MQKKPFLPKHDYLGKNSSTLQSGNIFQNRSRVELFWLHFFLSESKGHHTPHLRQSATLSAILTGSQTVALTAHTSLCKIVHLHHPRSSPIIRRIGDCPHTAQSAIIAHKVADEVYGGLKGFHQVIMVTRFQLEVPAIAFGIIYYPKANEQNDHPVMIMVVLSIAN